MGVTLIDLMGEAPRKSACQARMTVVKTRAGSDNGSARPRTACTADSVNRGVRTADSVNRGVRTAGSDNNNNKDVRIRESCMKRVDVGSKRRASKQVTWWDDPQDSTKPTGEHNTKCITEMLFSLR